MPYSGDWRDELSTDEDVKPARLTERTAQVSWLPFSVEALMSDRRPPNATDRKDGDYFLTDHILHRQDEFTQQLIKSESSEQGASLTPSPVKISTPFRKSPRVMPSKIHSFTVK